MSAARYAVVQADVLAFLRTQPSNSFDALLSDPPYGLEFMGQRWDYDVPSVETWAECIRVLKPGAPILSYGGARTFHRIFCGLEDGGAELCDCIMWVYGQGMPKPATTTDKYLKTPGEGPWEGHGHALSPGHEPIALACKRYDGTIANNILTHGVGALNVGACRLGGQVTINRWTDGAKPFGGGAGHPYESVESEGRWPKNVILSHAPECVCVGTREVRTGTAVKRNGVSVDSPVLPGALGNYPPGTPDAGYADGGRETVEMWACVPGCPVRQMDDQSGARPSTLTGRADPSKPHAHPATAGAGSWYGASKPKSSVYADSGGASRFFYHAKVNRKERDFGCEHLPIRSAAACTKRREGTVGANRPQAGAGRGSGARNFHPTLKPIALNEYLARLLLPPSRDAILLVPFAGAGSEVIGAIRAGWPMVLGIERDLDEDGNVAGYLEIANARLRAWCPEAVAA